MTDPQSNNLDMYIIVNDFYLANQTTIDLVPARATAFGQLGTNIASINKEIAGQSTNPTGVTVDKSALRTTLDNITVTILASAKAWAVATEDNTLAAEFDYSLSEIQKIKDDTIQGFCNYRIGLVNDNLVALGDYGIDAATVTAWQDALNAYVAVLENPRKAINERHLHTEALKTLFTDTGNLFKQQLDPLMLVFKSTDPNLYSAYKQARIIIDRGSSGASTISADTVKITGTMSNSNTAGPIVGGTVTLNSADAPEPIVVTTDVNGDYVLEFGDVPADTTFTGTLDAAAQGFEPITEPIEVQAGNAYVIDFELTPVVGP